MSVFQVLFNTEAKMKLDTGLIPTPCHKPKDDQRLA